MLSNLHLPSLSPAFCAHCAGPIGRPLPTFPAEFYTGIDVSITNKGYAYTVYEAYDAKCQAVVQEIFLPTLGHTRYLYDYAHGTLWTVRGATADAPASCSQTSMDASNPFVHEDGVALASSARFLSFHKDSRYIPRAQLGYPDVRCASCQPLTPSIAVVLPRHALLEPSQLPDLLPLTAGLCHYLTGECT